MKISGKESDKINHYNGGWIKINVTQYSLGISWPSERFKLVECKWGFKTKKILKAKLQATKQGLLLKDLKQ